ncbi:MAG: hypothetical protein ACYCZ7_00705 [Minisyncoccota bacterium]
MTQRVSDEMVATFARQQHYWMERVLKGSLDPVEVARAVQDIVNGGWMFNPFIPNTYFKTREGLWVASSFNDRILSKVAPMPYRGLEGVTSSVLTRNMHDKEIIGELLGGMGEVRKHAFTLDQIAEMISLQSNGEDGKLTNNGYANIFYVLVGGVLFAGYANWNSDNNRKWNVSGWRLGEGGHWNAGNRVFRNTTLVI